jgi:hypothetical protein
MRYLLFPGRINNCLRKPGVDSLNLSCFDMFPALPRGTQMAEYRIDVVDADGSFIRSIHIDCPDDKAAIETAKQFIDGHDIELWQRNRLLDRFDHKHRTSSLQGGPKSPK